MVYRYRNSDGKSSNVTESLGFNKPAQAVARQADKSDRKWWFTVGFLARTAAAVFWVVIEFLSQSSEGALPPRDVRRTRQPGSGPTLLRRDLSALRAFFSAFRA